MRVYLDMCCIKRPFDDQVQARVHLETVAVETILLICHQGGLALLSSDALRFENSRNPNRERKDFASQVLDLACESIANSAAVEQRAAVFQSAGIRLLDALHASSAEAGGADVFCTCDDDLLSKVQPLIKGVRVLTPSGLLAEVLR